MLPSHHCSHAITTIGLPNEARLLRGWKPRSLSRCSLSRLREVLLRLFSVSCEQVVLQLPPMICWWLTPTHQKKKNGWSTFKSFGGLVDGSFPPFQPGGCFVQFSCWFLGDVKDDDFGAQTSHWKWIARLVTSRKACYFLRGLHCYRILKHKSLQSEMLEDSQKKLIVNICKHSLSVLFWVPEFPEFWNKPTNQPTITPWIFTISFLWI